MSDEKEQTIQSGVKIFQAEEQQAQAAEVGIYGMFKNQKEPELEYND